MPVPVPTSYTAAAARFAARTVLKLRILLDKNSIEVFANDGEQTMTAWIYTPQSADGIAFAADGEATVTVEQFELNL